VNAPAIEEAPIQLECRISHVLRVPPARTVYLAAVVAAHDRNRHRDRRAS